MRNEAKTRPGNYARLDTLNQGERRLKDNTQTKLRSDSANVKVA